ncbi:MAG: 4-hydroxythreonine-4-phosphate dehydrogenase PdxA [bacterium]
MPRPPKLHVTLGDPDGIGPEVVLRALRGWSGVVPVVHGHRAVLDRAARLLGIPAPGTREGPPLELREPEGADPFEQPGRAQVAILEQAARSVGQGEVDALVTAPISKDTICGAGFAFPGHTDFLASRAGTDAVMLFAGPRLRVALATVHVPLREVADHLTAERLVVVLKLTASALCRDFGISRPRIAVAGLNPHAGEAGLLGDEEERVMAPAIRAARASVEGRGIKGSIHGPIPGDSVFRRALAQEFDVVVAAYHDQALIPVKLLDFQRTVNVTLGLPYVRTSPAHGTAKDIAWTGRADPTSMVAALELALKLASRRCP